MVKDEAKLIRLIVDSDLNAEPQFLFHPLENKRTTEASRSQKKHSTLPSEPLVTAPNGQRSRIARSLKVPRAVKLDPAGFNVPVDADRPGDSEYSRSARTGREQRQKSRASLTY